MSDAAIDARWPHQVEIEVPWDGLGRRLSEMMRWAETTAPGYKRRSEGRDHLRFCFGDPDLAAAFQVAFGGRLVVVEARVP